MKVYFTRTDKPAGKVADAELHFGDGDGILNGTKLVGFAIWERRTGGGLNVTFPARQYSVNGERRSFALLRPMTDANATNQIRDYILAAWAVECDDFGAAAERAQGVQ